MILLCLVSGTGNGSPLDGNYLGKGGGSTLLLGSPGGVHRNKKD